MRYIAIVVLFAGLGMAGYAVVLAQDHIERIQAEQTVVQEVPTVRVAVFASDLPQGHVVQESDLRVVEYTEGAVPPARITELAQAVGMSIRADVLSGQPVLTPVLSAEPIAMRPLIILVRRGTETDHVCVARCPEES